MQPELDVTKATRSQIKFSAAIIQITKEKEAEQRKKPILNRIATMFAKDDGQKESIYFQRSLYILQLPASVRNIDQVKFLAKHFDEKFTYIQQIKQSLAIDIFEDMFYNVTLESFEPLQTVFLQGEVGRKMYFILEGEVGVLLPTGMNGQNQPAQSKQDVFLGLVQRQFQGFRLISTKRAGEHFGEIALESRIPRTATIVTKTACKFAILTYEVFHRCLGAFQDRLAQARLSFLTSIPLFARWSKAEQLVFLHSCEEQQFQTGTYLYRQGDTSDCAFIVQSGEVIVEQQIRIMDRPKSDTNLNGLMKKFTLELKVLGIYDCGQLFGDFEIQTYTETQVKRTSSAKTRADTKVLSVKLVSLLDIFRVQGKLEDLRTRKQGQAEMRSKLQEQGVGLVELADPKQIDVVGIGETYFHSKKRQEQIKGLTQQLRKIAKNGERNEIHEQLMSLYDPEGEIKDLFVDRFSSLVPFRNHPYNKETECIKHKTRRSPHAIRPKTSSKEERYFSPQCSILSIISEDSSDKRTDHSFSTIAYQVSRSSDIQQASEYRMPSRTMFDARSSTDFPSVDLLQHNFGSQGQISPRNNRISLIASRNNSNGSLFGNEVLSNIQPSTSQQINFKDNVTRHSSLHNPANAFGNRIRNMRQGDIPYKFQMVGKKK